MGEWSVGRMYLGGDGGGFLGVDIGGVRSLVILGGLSIRCQVFFLK